MTSGGRVRNATTDLLPEHPGAPLTSSLSSPLSSTSFSFSDDDDIEDPPAALPVMVVRAFRIGFPPVSEYASGRVTGPLASSDAFPATYRAVSRVNPSNTFGPTPLLLPSSPSIDISRHSGTVCTFALEPVLVLLGLFPVSPPSSSMEGGGGIGDIVVVV